MKQHSRRINWHISDVLRRWLKFWMETSARVKGERFYCKALAGESEYNLTINCDQTVSCNCQDYNGSGHIGDLGKTSFKDVFFGPVANRFPRRIHQHAVGVSRRRQAVREGTRTGAGPFAGWLTR